MFNISQLNSSYCCINFKEQFCDPLSQQKLKYEFDFQSKEDILRKFYLEKNDSKIGEMNSLSLPKHKKYLIQVGKQNVRLDNNFLAKQNQFFQIKCKKKIFKKSKNFKILGGGCRLSKFEIQNPQQISISIKKGMLDEKFMQNYDYFTDNKKIVENLEYEKQGEMQVDIIQYITSPNIHIHIRRDIIIYKPKLIKLIETYLIYVLTGSCQKEVLKQNEIKELGELIKDMKESFEMESRDQPSCDLIFYFDFLYRFNSIRIGKDEQNKSYLIQAQEFLTTIVKLGAGALKTIGGDFMEGINLGLQSAQFLLKQYQEYKTNQFFSYLLDIWVRKTVQFKERIWDLTILEELEFYITIFNELCSKQDYETDLVLLTLIKIDYYFSLALEDQNDIKVLSHKLSLNCELIKLFIPLLIQKSNSQSIFDEMESFLKFTVQNHTYRFLTISILLKYNTIIQDTNEFQDYKEYIVVFLCYKYLCEKNKPVKLVFETSGEFVEQFNSKIQQEQFQNKIIQLSNERNKDLKSLLDLEGYEEKIDNSQDIERMIANILIDKWERNVKKRQQDDIAQKDDILLEVKDLYIQQSIIHLEGNKIFQERNEYNPPIQRPNALQQILDNFLFDYVQTEENQNINITEGLIKCKILGILAEGGTGKSMFIKKLETHLIQSANSNSEKENYIPILIKCNSLDQLLPSIENYLLAQGVNQQQISTLKLSNRNKVILLDGYDEFSGEYFRVYQQLNLHTWKNTKVIVTSRKEKLELSDACTKFSLDGDNGLRDETSFCLVQLQEFTKNDILEYCKIYFKQYRTKEEQFDELQYQNDINIMIDCMKNRSLEGLLYLPINLYLFTRMIVQIKDQKDIQKIKENISDQYGIQEIFFYEQFKREAQDFMQAQIKQQSRINKDFSQFIINSFFEYFQSISMQMFLNKGKPQIINFLQLRKEKIKFKLSNIIEKQLSEKEKNVLLEKIKNYVNSKIVTRSKEDVANNQEYNKEQSKIQLIEFRHKSLFEYFVARAMKYDFEIHGDNVHKLTIEQLKQFNINQKCIMNVGQNQSEQQILIKLYMMIKNEIESEEFYSTYYLSQIEKNSRYIQYIKKSAIKNNSETSQIDIGASNMLTAMFISRFSYSKLKLSCCSISKLYVSCLKSDSINFDACNLQYAYLKNLHINYDSCNMLSASFDGYPKVFDTSNIYSFNQVIWDKSNKIKAITESGFINAFKFESEENVLLQNSKQLSQTPLSQVVAVNSDTLLVSSQFSLFLIGSNSFELLESFKFKDEIKGFTLIKENILVTFKNEDIFHGSFKAGFRKMNMSGSGCVYNESKRILLVYSSGDFSLYNPEDDFKLINTISGHAETISSVSFSADGEYLATGSSDETCKIWNVQKDFELIHTINGHTSGITSVAFSTNGRFLSTGSEDTTCKIWNAVKSYELLATMEGHSSNLCSVAFSADGKYFATGSKDEVCKIWNVEKSFELINTIQGHASGLCSISFSMNGKYLATGSYDKTCKIWDAEKGYNLINTIQGHTEEINSVAFSHDGKHLATGSEDKTCKIWNAEKDFELMKTISGHIGSIKSIAFSTNGKYLATSSDDETCKIWNSEIGFELIDTISGHTGSIQSVAFSTNGKYLATGSDDETCKIWNAEKGFELINTIEGHTSSVRSLVFSSDGKYLSTGSKDQTCIIWNVEKDFELIKTIEGHASGILSVAFTADGKYLATSSEDITCKLWDVEKGFELINTIQGHTDSINSVVFSVDGKSLLVTSSDDKTFKVWNAEKSFELINKIQGHTHPVNSAAFSADGKYLVTCSIDKTYKKWNAKQGFELMSTNLAHTDNVYSISFSANGKYLATGSEDQTCKIWNAEQGFELVFTIEGHDYGICSVAFSADGKYLATGSSDKTCKVWSVDKSFELINTIKGHTFTINSVTFSTDGKYLATGSSDKTCKIWNAEKNFELINTIKGHSSGITSIVFSANRKYLATGSQDDTCKIWNVEKDFELINTIDGHNSGVISVAFSVDGKFLATGSYDKTCKIWNAENGFELVNTIQGQKSGIYSLAFSVDGKYLASCTGSNIGSWDNICTIWNVEKGFEFINIILSHTSSISSVVFSADGKHICIEQKDKSYNIYDSQNLKIISENVQNYEQLQEKYQFGKINQNNQFENMRIFEKIFIL